MITVIKSIIALLLSYGLLLMANGMFSTLLGIRTSIEGFATELIGVVMASYFLGLFIGARYAAHVVALSGHIRAFAAFASVMSITALLHVLLIEPVVWAVVRAISGFCFAGLVMVTESWLNERAENTNRGRILSLYMGTNYFASGCGQFLLPLADPSAYHLFSAASIIFSLALIPVLVTRSQAPLPSAPAALSMRALYRISPVGMSGAFVSGFINSAFYGMGPVYAREIGLSLSGIAVFMATPILCGLLLQWQIGRISDRVDRRRVLFAVTVGTGVACIAIALSPASQPLWKFITGRHLRLAGVHFVLHQFRPHQRPRTAHAAGANRRRPAHGLRLRGHLRAAGDGADNGADRPCGFVPEQRRRRRAAGAVRAEPHSQARRRGTRTQGRVHPGAPPVFVQGALQRDARQPRQGHGATDRRRAAALSRAARPGVLLSRSKRRTAEPHRASPYNHNPAQLIQHAQPARNRTPAMPSATTTLELRLHDRVGYITLHRPGAGNPLDNASYGELNAALDRCEAAGAGLRCLLLGARGDVFCNGSGAAPTSADRRDRCIDQLAARISALALPVVCAVNGDARDSGADLALACDVVYAVRTARFIRPFHGLGLAPDCDNRWIPPRLLLYNRILTLGQFGQSITAPEAHHRGLISGCLDDAEALAAASEEHAAQLAATTSRYPARALRQHAHPANGQPPGDVEREIEARAANAPGTGTTDPAPRKGGAAPEPLRRRP